MSRRSSSIDCQAELKRRCLSLGRCRRHRSQREAAGSGSSNGLKNWFSKNTGRAKGALQTSYTLARSAEKGQREWVSATVREGKSSEGHFVEVVPNPGRAEQDAPCVMLIPLLCPPTGDLGSRPPKEGCSPPRFKSALGFAVALSSLAAFSLSLRAPGSSPLSPLPLPLPTLFHPSHKRYLPRCHYLPLPTTGKILRPLGFCGGKMKWQSLSLELVKNRRERGRREMDLTMSVKD